MFVREDIFVLRTELMHFMSGKKRNPDKRVFLEKLFQHLLV